MIRVRREELLEVFVKRTFLQYVSVLGPEAAVPRVLREVHRYLEAGFCKEYHQLRLGQRQLRRVDVHVVLLHVRHDLTLHLLLFLLVANII